MFALRWLMFHNWLSIEHQEGKTRRGTIKKKEKKVFVCLFWFVFVVVLFWDFVLLCRVFVLWFCFCCGLCRFLFCVSLL